MMEENAVLCSAGEGKYRISSYAVRCGADLCVTVCGGEKHHVGAVSLGVYEPERDSATVSTLTVYTHRDDAVSSRFAKKLSSALRCTVTVTAGIHVDDADADDLRVLNGNCDECLNLLIKALEEEN
ncbi:MAG: hypothetical protein HUJ65_00825 [Oscillospiraceae bacterium]|nr:hypothetical protein [Oscillospiraceae bacterium]